MEKHYRVHSSSHQPFDFEVVPTFGYLAEASMVELGGDSEAQLENDSKFCQVNFEHQKPCGFSEEMDEIFQVAASL